MSEAQSLTNPNRTSGAPVQDGRLEAVLNNASVAIVFVDERRRCAFMNPAAERLTGYALREARGRALHELVHPARPDGRPCPAEACPLDGSPARLARESGEAAIVRKDGGFVPVAYAVSPLRGDDGAVAGTVVELRDISREKRAEETLRLHALLLDSMTEGVSLSAEDGTIVYTNPAEDRMFGYAPGELIGRNVAVQNAYPPEESAARVAQVIAELKRSGVWEGEWHNRRKDGSEFFTASRITAVRIGGRPHWLCVQRDVTETRRAREALRASEEQLRVALQAARLGAWERDLRTGVLTATPTCKTNLGLPPDAELTFEMLQSMRHPDDAARVNAAIREAVVNGAEYDVEYRVVAPDGGVRWVLARGHAVYDEARRPVRMVGVTLDITERKRAEEALRLSEARLREAQDIAGLGHWTFDAATGAITWSDEVYRIFGRDPAQGPPTLDELRALIHPEDRDRFDLLVRQVLASGDGFETEWRALRPDGTHRWKRTRARAYRSASGSVTRLIGTDLDITERRQAEERLRLLAREVDHRAKNILSIVQAMVRLTRAETVDGFVKAIEGRIAALARAHTLLSESRWQGTDLMRLVSDEIAAFRTGSEARVEIAGPEVMLSPVAAQSFAMAVHELATNAAKYGALSTPAGRLDIRWSFAPEPGLRLRWTETGGPPARPPQRQGFGTRVVDQSIRGQLGGAVRTEWPPEGLVCEITVPAAELR